MSFELGLVVPSFLDDLHFDDFYGMLTTMFVRQKKRPQHTDDDMRMAVQIVEGERIGESVKQQVLYHVGVARNEQERIYLCRLGDVIRSILMEDEEGSLFRPEQLPIQQAPPPLAKTGVQVDVTQLSHVGTYQSGIPLVYGTIYRELGLDKILMPSRFRKSNQVLFETVMARLGQPSSKRQAAAYIAASLGGKTALESIYRMMSHLTPPRMDRIRQVVQDGTEQLLPQPLQTLFFDCTTLFFESTNDHAPVCSESSEKVPADEIVDLEDEDSLLAFGYSKDGKPQRVQIGLALVVDASGLPVTYSLFKGNRFEAHTLLPVLKKLQQPYGQDLTGTVLVADAGMLNRVNLESMEKKPLSYVTGARLKKLPQDVKQRVLAHDWSNETIAEWSLEPHRRLVVWHSPKRARRDRALREKAIERAKRRLEKSASPQTLVSKGAGRFLRIKGSAQVVLNEKLIEEAAAWDGLGGVVTNSTQSREAIHEQYHGLWQVERAFRDQKHELEMRPVFHWTTPRIRAHVAICYMAFACLRHLEHRLRLKGHAMSPARIRAAVNTIQDIVMTTSNGKQSVTFPSQLTADANTILKVMKIKKSRQVTVS